ncbi:hypothetical protein HYS49_02160 [Candidatus Woesearchaeota archaeon]|nr:hypothetical protein [Candidatus Woesearchaeota archaeon]
MERKLYFFAIFFITILIIRTFLYVHPTPGPTINGFRIHHYMFGLVLAPIGALAGSIALYAMGVGLFIDELGYLIIGGKTHEENYSKASLLLLGLFIMLTFLFREQLLFWKALK